MVMKQLLVSLTRYLVLFVSLSSTTTATTLHHYYHHQHHRRTNTPAVYQCYQGTQGMYMMYPLSSAWDRASKVCQDHDSELPQPKDQMAMKDLMTALKLLVGPAQTCWIGLQGTANGMNYRWEWSDGTTLGPVTFWDSNFRNPKYRYSYCAFLTHKASWAFKRCINKSSVVCLGVTFGWSPWSAWSSCRWRSNTRVRSRSCQASHLSQACQLCRDQATQTERCKGAGHVMHFQKFPWNPSILPKKALISLNVSGLLNCASVCFANEDCDSFVIQRNSCHLFQNSSHKLSVNNQYIFHYGYKLVNYSGHM